LFGFLIIMIMHACIYDVVIIYYIYIPFCPVASHPRDDHQMFLVLS
jgi:hypothetical protein